MPKKKLEDSKLNKDAKIAKAKISKKETEKKKKKLLEKAKELEKKIKEKKIERKREEKKSKEEKGKEEENLLELFVKCGIHLGTKVITPMMRPYVYKRRNDGLAVLNTNLIEEKTKEAASFLANFEPEDIIVVCKREAGWRAVRLFSELTGIRAFTKKYPAGVITNTILPNFFEPELIIVSDPWLDKNALTDANKINKKIIALCDTNNIVKKVDVFIPCNNKSNKSLGLIYWYLTKEYLKARGIKKEIPDLEEFVGEKLIDVSKSKIEKKRREELEKQKKKIEGLLRKK